MSNPITDWRTELVTLLETAFPDAEVMSGQRDNVVSRDKDRISVFWPQTAIASNINYAQPQMMIRFWCKYPKASAQLKNVPKDDGPLEQASWDLSVALKGPRTTLVAGLYYELASIKPVRDEFAIEALLGAWIVNPAAL